MGAVVLDSTGAYLQRRPEENRITLLNLCVFEMFLTILRLDHPGKNNVEICKI